MRSTFLILSFTWQYLTRGAHSNQEETPRFRVVEDDFRHLKVLLHCGCKYQVALFQRRHQNNVASTGFGRAVNMLRCVIYDSQTLVTETEMSLKVVTAAWSS